MPNKVKLILIYLTIGAGGLLAGKFIAQMQSTKTADQVNQAPVEGYAKELPDLLWQDLEGQSQNLRQFLGKVVVVNHWAPWCEPCREEIPLFIDLQQQKGGDGLQFIGVAHDSPGNVMRFVDSMPINYPQVLAGDFQGMDWMKALGNPGSLPFTSVYDREGQLIGKKLGLLSADQLDDIIGAAL
ncbi:MAG: thiol-disulfide isomerase/thioredoxin [Saprospiraceae bacterium]|jgi:thiol-disulfide isomerase/thioredoxin